MVPRQEQFGEHVNNHQVDFLKELFLKYELDYILNISELENIIKGKKYIY